MVYLMCDLEELDADFDIEDARSRQSNAFDNAVRALEDALNEPLDPME